MDEGNRMMAAPTPIPAPPDYDPTIPLRKAAAVYGVSRATLGRWRRDMGYRARLAHDAWTDAEDHQLKVNFSAMSYAALSDLIGRTESAVKARAIQLGLRRKSSRYQRDLRARFDGQQAKGIADMAARHLRRDGPVYRCDEKGEANPKGKCWRYGNIVLTEVELLAKAERKGWRVDAWREIA